MCLHYKHIILPGVGGEFPHSVFYGLLSVEAIFLVLNTFLLPVGFFSILFEAWIHFHLF